MTKLVFDTHETRLSDNRKVAVWTLAPSGGPRHPMPLVVGAGFARRMHHFSSVAEYGAHNGFFVCRYDPVNHVGLSDGDMWDYTMTDGLESLRAAVNWACEHTGRPRVIVLATSLTARVAYQLASQTDRIASVVTAVGVVNVQETLKRVFDYDHSLDNPEEITGHVEFEGNRIGHRTFTADAHKNDWWSFEGCVKALRQVKQPVVNFIGSDDEWVEPAEVHKAFTEGAGGPRKLLTLDRAPHDLSRDSSVARTFLVRTMEELFLLCGVEQRVVEPPFEEMMEQALIERRLQRNSPDAPAARAP